MLVENWFLILITNKLIEYGNNYSRGVLDICMGIINDDERYIGMFDFACWYKEVLERDAAEEDL